jgi:hypothetical protein
MAVKFEQHTDIDAPPDKVWAIITDPKTWPLWFPDIPEDANVGSLAEGATFQWREGDEVGNGSIVSVDTASSRIQVVTQQGQIPVTHTFDLDRSGGFLGFGGNDTRLKYTMEYDPPGGFISDFIAGGNPKDLLKVKRTLDKVRGLAEGGQ